MEWQEWQISRQCRRRHLQAKFYTFASPVCVKPMIHRVKPHNAGRVKSSLPEVVSDNESCLFIVQVSDKTQ